MKSNNNIRQKKNQANKKHINNNEENGSEKVEGNLKTDNTKIEEIINET